MDSISNKILIYKTYSKLALTQGRSQKFFVGGAVVILSYWFAIQEKYKVWHIYIYTCLSALVLGKKI